YLPERGATLSPQMASKAEAIGQKFRERTGKTLQVTSGTRTSHSQARAMYVKYIAGYGHSTYRGPLGRQVGAVYEASKRAGDNADVTIAKMEAVIVRQIAAGHYISDHLTAHAIDFSVGNLNARDVRTLEGVIREEGGVPNANEGAPPHVHASF